MQSGVEVIMHRPLSVICLCIKCWMCYKSHRLDRCTLIRESAFGFVRLVWFQMWLALEDGTPPPDATPMVDTEWITAYISCSSNFFNFGFSSLKVFRYNKLTWHCWRVNLFPLSSSWLTSSSGFNLHSFFSRLYK